jgi:probable rRNA maturation factor
MIVIDVKNLAKTAVNLKLVKAAASEVIKGESGGVESGRDIEVSIAFVGSRKIREINKKYRKINSVTDVLSFAEEDGDVGTGCDYPRIMGELVICPQQVRKDARELGVAIEKELVWVVVHGMLHLFGYDHESGEEAAELMRRKEEFYLSKIK